MRIAVVGTGYVGLVSGACLADAGHDVVCIDREPERIAILRAGAVPFYEPELENVVKRSHAAQRLAFAEEIEPSVASADVIFICVGTPSRVDGSADLSCVHEAVREIAPWMKSGAVIAVKSTVPVGTCDEVERAVRAIRPRDKLAVVSNPEFLRQGSAVGDFQKADRIIVGASDPEARDRMAELYDPFRAAGVPLVFTSRRSAEMIKYTANAFLAAKVAFINEIANLCECVDADVAEVAHGVGLDRRIGSEFLRPGPGFGGSCFPKDSRALLRMAHKRNIELRVVAGVLAANDARKDDLFARICTILGCDLRGKRIAVLGLTFKAATDDLRDSPSLDLINKLAKAGASLRVHDPIASRRAEPLLPRNVAICAELYGAADEADALVVMTEWDEFAQADLLRLAKLMRRRIVFDFRNIFDASSMAEAGFFYARIGRSPAAAPKVIPHRPIAAPIAAVRTSADARAKQESRLNDVSALLERNGLAKAPNGETVLPFAARPAAEAANGSRGSSAALQGSSNAAGLAQFIVKPGRRRENGPAEG